MPRKRSYLADYRTPDACRRVAPVRRIDPEDRDKDNATTFRLERRAIDNALYERARAEHKAKS